MRNVFFVCVFNVAEP